MTSFTATYAPTENKLRLYATERLDPDLYARVKAAGFSWAPRQKLFVASAWTPSREDLLIELCGDISDEETSLVQRAEERAERFEGYSDSREKEAGQAAAAAEKIAGRFEFGQPILVGHHSEKRARKDKERIESNMHKAVKSWETASYWTERAAGAINNAEYKELPAVRYRRIKGLESDARKKQRAIDEANENLSGWTAEGLTLSRALALAERSYFSMCFTLAKYPRSLPASQYEGQMSLWSALEGGVINLEQAIAITVAASNRTIHWGQRWLTHYNNRIAYERAMLGEQGGIAAERFAIEPGGRVLVRGQWSVVRRVNKKNGVVVSVTTTDRFVSVRGIEEIKDYQAPSAAEQTAIKASSKLPPIVNFPGADIVEMTSQEWKDKNKDYKGTEIAKATSEHGRYRDRVAQQDFGRYPQIFITDAKRVDPPPPAEEPASPTSTTLPVSVVTPLIETPKASRAGVKASVAAERIQLIKNQLAVGVRVVQAEQLFATPAALAEYAADLADIEAGQRILESSAGTGRIIRAITEAVNGPVEITAVEINGSLCGALRAGGMASVVLHKDFLECDDLGTFDRIVMNPPFSNGQDIAHTLHALPMLKSGGRFVGFCANGPRQQAKLRPLIENAGGTWEELPAGSFEVSGTMVNAVLMVFDRE